MCKTKPEAERALEIVQTFLAEMELETSPQKTKICHYSEGFNFLGFTIRDCSVKMRTKSREKFENKIREITTRSHNLDKEVIAKLNRVIRGTVNYFGTAFSTMKSNFRELDRWIRRRIRCMKYKRINKIDNSHLLNKHIKQMGLLNCYDLHKTRLKC